MRRHELVDSTVRQALPGYIDRGVTAYQFEAATRHVFAALNGDPEFEAIVAEFKRRIGEE